MIDFGSMGGGDPALDLIPAWAVFGRPGRAAYRAALRSTTPPGSVRAASRCTRRRLIIPYYRESNPAFTALAERTVEQLARA